MPSVFRTGYGCAVQLLLILLWLTDIKDSDSYFFVYALCALAGISCIYSNQQDYRTRTARQYAGILIPAALFSVMVVLANYPVYEPITASGSVFKLCADLLGGTVIAANILSWLLNRLPVAVTGTEARNRPLQFFALCMASFVVIDVVYLIFCDFPGVLTADSVNQMNQIYSGEYNNLNPFWHTRTIGIFVNIGKTLFGTYQAGVAVFSVVQILFMAACFSYVLVTLYQKHIPWKWIAVCWMIYGLLPYQIAYSVTMWKDVLFSGACLLLTTALYRILSRMPGKKSADFLLFIAGSFGMCLWRTNGLLAYGVLFLAMLITAAKNGKLIKTMAVIFGVCILLNSVVLSAMNVGGGSYVEALSVPLQQVARVVYEGRDLDPEALELIETVADAQRIRDTYEDEISDPIKELVRSSDAEEQIQKDPLPYLKLWLDLGSQYPADYVKAWVDLTKGYWNGGYDYWIWTDDVYENHMGIEEAAVGGPVGKLMDLYFRYSRLIVFLQPVVSIGLNTWLLMLCWIVDRKQGRMEWLLLLPSFSILLGLLIGTPVYAEFRYAYPMILSCPLIVSATWFSSSTEKD